MVGLPTRPSKKGIRMKIKLNRDSVKRDITQLESISKVENKVATTTDSVTQVDSNKLKGKLPTVESASKSNLENLLDTEKSSKTELPEVLRFYADTEFSQLLEGMISLAVPVFCPELDIIHCFDKNDLSEEFDLISSLLEKQGCKVGKINRYDLEDKLNSLWRKKGYKSFTGKSYKQFIKEKLVITEFEKIGLDINNCTIEYSKKKKKLYVRFKSVKVEFQFFFAYADLFRIFGQDCQVIWYERAKLTQFRTIKIMGKVRITRLIDGIPTDFDISIFDNRYCFPPRKGSLDGQAKTFGVDSYLEDLKATTNNQIIKELISKSTSKIKISEQIKKKFGDDVTEQWCKENMWLVREKYPVIFAEYAMMDCLVTWALNQALNGMLGQVAELLEIEKPNLAETCGKNIENILLGLIKKHFAISDGKDSNYGSKELLETINLGRSESLAKIDGNQFGIVPSSVVGGLLFSRTAKESIILGHLFDLDLKSCYATALTSMNLYLGEPIHLTFKYDKPTVKRVVELIRQRKLPKDAWMIRASGMLEKATNTLILSDSSFDNSKCILTDNKRYAMPTDIDLEAESINLIDAEKASEPTALSKVLTKEINHGVITEATLTALSDLPDEFYQEFLNLKVDAIIYYEPSTMCESVEEFIEKKVLMPVNSLEEFLTENLQKSTVTKLSSNHVSLLFPIGKYYDTVAKLRGQMKKAGMPVQEIFKLVLNSTYGILASLVMKVNNPIAANWITSCARASAWRMSNACNGFNPITDGTAINSKAIPFGMTFHKVLKKYPDYLEHYQPNISNDKVLNFSDAGDFNAEYICHLEQFIGKSDWLSQMYAYDLKDEDNDFHYQKHYNTNAGNYNKTGKFGDSFKCRSYRKTDELVAWFKECSEKEYKRHLIYADKSILKLSQGSVDTMRILKDAEDVANKGKSLIKMPSELAEKIAVDGICHPMGFSRFEVKTLKLISPSQFLCKDTRQFKILLSFYEECKNISKLLLPADNWNSKLAIQKIENEFPIITSDGNIQKIEYRSDLDYAAYNRFNPVGLGFELLIWANQDFKVLNDVRKRFVELIDNYSSDDDRWDIRANLNWLRLKENLESNIYLKHFFAAVQIAKLNYEIDYRETLANSVTDPMSRIQILGDTTTLRYEKTKNI